MKKTKRKTINGPLTAIHAVGGRVKLAKIAGRHHSTVSHWIRRGVIPSQALITILKYTQKHNIKLNANDLLMGA